MVNLLHSFFVGIVLLWAWACLGCAQSSMVPNTMDSLDYQGNEWNAKKIIENRGKNNR